MVAESFGLAAGQFAVGFVSRWFWNREKRSKLEGVYHLAAGKVVHLYFPNDGNLTDPRWTGLIGLLGDPDFGGALAFSGKKWLIDLDALKTSYPLEDPSVEEVFIKMVEVINPMMQVELSIEGKIIAKVIANTANVLNLANERHNRDIAENTRLANQVLELTKEILGNLPPKPSAGEYADRFLGQLMPSDEDYRVERSEMRQLADQLESQSSTGIAGVVGEGGVGKSLLAIHYALQNFADSTIYVSLDSGNVRASIDSMARRLGLYIPPDWPDVDAGARLREALSKHDGLLVLDNAESQADIQLLIPPPGGLCKIIVTARDQTLLRSLIPSDPVVMGQFDEEQARECFQARLGQERFDKEAVDIDRLSMLLDYLPLAVDAAAAIIHDGDIPVKDWLTSFPSEKTQLDALNPEGKEIEGLSAEQARRYNVVWAVLRLGLKNLGTVPRRLLFAISCFDSDIGAPQSLIIPSASLSQDEQAVGPVALNRLYQRSILRISTNGNGGDRYTMHRLMREVVRREASDEQEVVEAAWISLMTRWSLHLDELLKENRSSDAIQIFHQESANFRKAAEFMIHGSSIPGTITGSLPSM